LCRPPDAPGFFELQNRLLARFAETFDGALVMAQERGEWIRETESAKQFWQAQAERQKTELKSHAEVVKQQAQWIHEVEQAKEFWRAQAEQKQDPGDIAASEIKTPET
jgi:hypothetical protein